MPCHPTMKTSCCFSLSASPLRIALVLAIGSLTAAPARAENPLKFLRSKAKQGISKVVKVVNPRRIGTAIKNVVVEPAPRIPVGRVKPPVAYYDGTTSPDGTIYYPGPPTSPRRYPPETNRPTTTAPDPQRYSPADDPSGFREHPPQIRNTAPAPASPADRPAIGDQGSPTGPTPASRPAALRQNPGSGAPASTAVPDSKSRAAPAGQKSPASTKAASSPAPRQDLPFGELVPGKTGFVYSPYSTKELVDVSGIPTGTKVKCPYSGKTFRVP